MREYRKKATAQSVDLYKGDARVTDMVEAAYLIIKGKSAPVTKTRRKKSGNAGIFLLGYATATAVSIIAWLVFAA